jgi:hypothetical protein
VSAPKAPGFYPHCPLRGHKAGPPSSAPLQIHLDPQLRKKLAQATVGVAIKKAPIVVATAQITTDCLWAPGTVIWVPTSTSGGNGKPITWTLSGPSYLTINASTGAVSVAADGIPASSCSGIAQMTVTPTQPP